MKTRTNEHEVKLARRAEMYRTISLRRLAMLFKVEKSEAQKILDRAAKKGILQYERVNGRVQLQPTKLTASIA